MRTFIAIDLPKEIRDKIYEVASQFSQSGVTIVGNDVLHISLHFLGERSDDEISRLKETMDEIKSQSFGIEVRELGLFSPEYLKVIFAKVSSGREQCNDLYSQLSKSMLARGFEPEIREYTPHVTIARIRRVNDRRRILAMVEEYANENFGAFEVGSVKLKASEITPEGPVYKDLYEVKF